MENHVREKDLYPIVNRWAAKHFQCFNTAVDKGLKYGRIDVVGIRDIGGDLSGDIETIAIEVKKGNTPFAKASGQTLGYRVYANRVYLADVRIASFTADEISIASNLGIGLIQVKGKTCTEVLTSPFYVPITRLNLMLLESMAIGRCQFCGSYFEIGDFSDKRYSKVTRENFTRAAAEYKGIMFWNEETSYRKNRFIPRRAQQDRIYDRRYICPNCIGRVFAPMLTAV